MVCGYRILDGTSFHHSASLKARVLLIEQVLVVPQLELAYQAQHYLEIYALGSVSIIINLYGLFIGLFSCLLPGQINVVRDK